MARASNSRLHVPALDGIRGIAILLVVVYHAVRYGGMEPTIAVDRVVHKIAMLGWSGVDLFFVLSGFLITGILYDAKGGDHYFRNFYARRTLRIFPLYYGFLFFFFIVIPWLFRPTTQFSSLLTDQVWYWTYLSNVSFALDGWPQNSALVHFWSLAVEEQFYLVWPLIIFFLNGRVLKLTCLAVALGALGLRIVLHTTAAPIAAYVLTPARMDALALGGLLALIAREPGGLSVLARWIRPAVLSASVGLALLFVWRHGLAFRDAWVQTAGFTLLAILFAGVLTMAVTAPARTIAGRFLTHPFMRFFGRYSYALYVFHHPIMYYMRQILTADSVRRLAGSQLPGQLLFTALTGSVSLAAAVVSWHLYESQLLKLKRVFPYGKEEEASRKPRLRATG